MELHEEIRRARKDMGLTQGELADLVGIQRRQVSTLERGGNVTLNTLKRVLAVLPNLREFTFEQLRMKPEYRDAPPFDWTLFYIEMHNFQGYLEDLTKAVTAWLNARPQPGEDPEELMRQTQALAKNMTEIMQRKPGAAGKPDD
jgi:transcriptional regulator with XRE-family HTH domain